MFKVLSSGRPKRRIMSPTTLAVSVAAHVLLLAGIAVGARGEPRERVVADVPLDDWILEDAPKAPVAPPPTPPEPRQPEETVVRPVPGDYVQPVPPDEIPKELPKFSPADPPLTDEQASGVGKRPGDFVGPAQPADDRPPTGEIPTEGDEVYQPSAVEERPALRNAAEMQRVLQRLYPDLLREAGVTGTTSLQFVVGPDGRVEEGSVQVVSTSNPAFAEPSVKAAERFRFRPAKVGGRAVRVLISMPIAWTMER